MKAKCPHCNVVLDVPNEYNGRKCLCPECDNKFHIHALSAEPVKDEASQTTTLEKAKTGQTVAVERDAPAVFEKDGPQKGPPAEPSQPKQAASEQRHTPKNPIEAVAFMAECREKIIGEMGKVIIGHTDVIDQLLTAFFAKGHCLLLGVPGLAKTLMVNTLSRTMTLHFQRIQFTPDLMPTDITGTNILEEDPISGKRSFRFQHGPLFTNMLLADEINRTPPKTQAALLEAMQERQVTAGKMMYQLPQPFLVLATQNPIEQEGTYPLPEAQLDRFIFMVRIEYQSEEEELQILLDTTRDKDDPIEPVLDGATIMELQDLVRSVPVSEHVAGYANRIMRATRPQSDDAPDFIRKWVHFGCGPRAGQSLLLAAKAHAVLHGRFDVACEDVRAYVAPTLRHRLGLNFAAASEGLDADAIIAQLLDVVAES